MSYYRIHVLAVHLSRTVFVLRSHVKHKPRAGYALSRLFLTRQRPEYSDLQSTNKYKYSRGLVPYTVHDCGTRDLEFCPLFRFVLEFFRVPVPRTITVRPLVSSTGGILAGCPPRAECRVLAERCTDYNCRRLDDDRRRPRTSATWSAASGGPTLPGVRACCGIPRGGGGYLSTDGASTGARDSSPVTPPPTCRPPQITSAEGDTSS